MRLLNTKTGKFKVFGDPQKVRYAILSHVWSKPEDRGAQPEQTYQQTCQLLDGIPDSTSTTPLSLGYSQKIQRFCSSALKDGFEWGWVDSSCIDKTSSSELSEAINSMYDWYRYAGVCYAWLHDFPDIDPSHPTFPDEFGKAKWFRRGWTLQELLAPSVLLFFSRTWRIIGSKYTLASAVETATGIDRSILTFKQSLDAISVARKMSWAAQRTTTQPEDEAYSLMGIFGVTISISYGEGHHAFIRLQEQILKHCSDQTIFAWGQLLDSPSFRFAPPSPDPSPLDVGLDKQSNGARRPITSPSPYEFLLASGPRFFKESSTFECLPRDEFATLLKIPPQFTHQEFPVTPYGMRADVPLLAISHDNPNHHDNLYPTHLALLPCKDQDGNVLALLLRPHYQACGRDFVAGAEVVGGSDRDTSFARDGDLSHYYRITHLSQNQIKLCQENIQMVDLYIPHCPSIAVQKLELEAPTHAALCDSREHFEVRFSGWSRTLLAQHGYTVIPGEDKNVVSRDGRLVFTPWSASTTTAIAIFKGDEHITLRIGRCTCKLPYNHDLLAVAVSARGRSSPLSEKEFQSRPHLKRDDHAHVQSWHFTGGFASKEVQLESPTRHTITLRLTFNHDTQRPSNLKAYRLGIEISAPTPFDSPIPGSPASSFMHTETPIPTNPSYSQRTYSQVAQSGGRRLPSHSATYQDQTSRRESLPQSLPRRVSSQPVPTIWSGHGHRTQQQWDHSLPPESIRGRPPSLFESPPSQYLGMTQYSEPAFEGSDGPPARDYYQGSLSPTPQQTPSSRDTTQPRGGRPGWRGHQGNNHGRIQQHNKWSAQDNGRGRGRGKQSGGGRGHWQPQGNTQYPGSQNNGGRGDGWARS